MLKKPAHFLGRVELEIVGAHSNFDPRRVEVYHAECLCGAEFHSQATRETLQIEFEKHVAENWRFIIGDPWAEAPVPGEGWVTMGDERRLEMVNAVLSRFGAVSAIRASSKGVVTVDLLDRPAGERGALLRAAEAALKEELDSSIVLYLEPRGDRNALRKLRGVEVRRDG